ncbi:MAG: ATPase [Acidimicrobiales bacterium]|nr:ATPase [Acidimicrobiales bacterium]
MASLGELARDRTALDADAIIHIQRLARVWGLLADLRAADLLLFAATTTPGQFVVLGHIRPVTATTTYPTDPIGRTYDRDQRNLVATAHDQGRVVEGTLDLPTTDERPAEVTAIPVRFGGQVIGVLSCEALPGSERPLSDLERTYRKVFDRLTSMIAEGSYPFARDEEEQYKAPRVGDGILLLDAELRLTYASPNAVSAIHRLGIHRPLIRRRLNDLDLDPEPLNRAVARREPATMEVERGVDNTVVMRCIPLLEGDTVTGVMVGLRDISELRRRDRLLMSKDATIREIHHRVKNNLQTISSLLRLQGRRLESVEARNALAESERRIASIALVHDTLANEGDAETDGDEVSFVKVVRPLVRLVEEGLTSPERPVDIRVSGDAGVLSSDVVMPLAVTLTEVLQNAVEHAFAADPSIDDGTVLVALGADDRQITLTVTDNGVGVPVGFNIDDQDGLGLAIVRTFIVSDLGGSIAIERSDGPPERAGTVVTIRVPQTRV